MRSKTPLALMEQAVMVLVFALAAALCLRVFVWSDYTSRLGADRDMAALRAQTAAETIKACAGAGDKTGAEVFLLARQTLGALGDEESIELGYDEKWEPCRADEASYILVVSPGEGETGLGRATVAVTRQKDNETLFTLECAYQTEVSRLGG